MADQLHLQQRHGRTPARGGFHRLELGAKADNVASQRAALSGGFQPDGVRAERLRNPDGTFSDEVRFTSLRRAD